MTMKFFSAIKLGYELIAALLAVKAGQPYYFYPVFKGKSYKISIEELMTP
jgi:hypothetical protein